MVGQSVLRECLQTAAVQAVTVVGRTSTNLTHPKLTEHIHADLWDFSTLETALAAFDACFYCLGVSSGGMSEEKYTRLTYDMTLACANTLARLNPQMVFIYVSGAGTDSTETSSTMWARVKGKTENAILALPFRAAYMFRPAAIQPMHGIVSKTTSYRVLYAVTKPLLPLLRWLVPNMIVTSDKLARVMLHVASHGADKRVLESADINAMQH